MRYPNSKTSLFTLVLLATLSAMTAWAGPISPIVTLAEDRRFPAATDPSTCKVFEFDPIEMGKFSRVTFVGKGNTPQFSIIYLFSLEPVKFSVPAQSGTGLGGQCDVIPAHDVFPPNNQLACQGSQGPAPYIAVALFSCSAVPFTVTVKAYLSN
jgi:hypothetical protein